MTSAKQQAMDLTASLQAMADTLRQSETLNEQDKNLLRKLMKKRSVLIKQMIKDSKYHRARGQA